MPPRNGRAGSSSYYHSPLARSNPGSGAYNLSVNPKEAYRDLLIFEERLKQNSARLASQRKKYEGVCSSRKPGLGLLVGEIHRLRFRTDAGSLHHGRT